MKYIKLYDSEFSKARTPVSDMDELKKLLSHLRKILEELGWEYEGYLDGRKFDAQFSMSLGEDRFKNMFHVFIYSELGGKILEIKRHKKDEKSKFLEDYLMTINGIEEDYYDQNIITSCSFWINDVDEIIKQISKDNIELFIDTKNFNL